MSVICMTFSIESLVMPATMCLLASGWFLQVKPCARTGVPAKWTNTMALSAREIWMVPVATDQEDRMSRACCPRKTAKEKLSAEFPRGFNASDKNSQHA